MPPKLPVGHFVVDTDTDTEPHPDADLSEPETLRADILRTRAALGETVEALSAKVNPKIRARQAVEGVKSAASQVSHRLRTDRTMAAALAAAAGAAVAGTVGLVAWRRRRAAVAATPWWRRG